MSSVECPLLSIVCACQYLQCVVSFADSIGDLYAVCVKETKVFKYTHSILGLRTRGSSESAILIFGWVLACAGSGVNTITDDFGADINSELTCKKRDISVKYLLTLLYSSGIIILDVHMLCHLRSKSA